MPRWCFFHLGDWSTLPMQSLPVSPEIADGPQRVRAGVDGGATTGVQDDRPEFPTPRTLQARGVRFSGPARRAGIPGKDA